ncbi:hypothetical protein PtrM4_055570 [Pyrenophora tritici-repentis]|uniref:Reverse transcriptase Ty1/copia-type domain-containing protein n=1 Tax=Pyrenophora tritici-repentis TaxID=45151 RepID=A0A834S1T4_9PLEO|nr:hypothetical protein PtrM4_055570 [Pyrenophora tritici-repentis]
MECRYTHSGERQAELLLQVIETYGIASKIGWYTIDNATSNNTILQHLERLLYAKGISFNAEQRRVRCIAHIINLSLQAFLLASSKEALEAAFTEAAEVEGEELINTFSDVLAERRKREAEERSTEKDQAVQEPRKRRRANTAESVASQESTADKFVGIENIPALRKLMILLNCSAVLLSTWTYGEILRAKMMKPQIVEFMFQHEVALGDNRLTGEDWQILDRAHEFLETFAEATLYAEGKSSIAQSLLIIEILLKKFEDEKKRYSSRPEKDLQVHKVLGVRVTRDRKHRTIFLDQEQYLCAVLDKFGMSSKKHKDKKIPSADYTLFRPATDNDTRIDTTEYQQGIGSLMFAMVLTRPDIAFTLGKLSQHMSDPAEHHGYALKNLLRKANSIPATPRCLDPNYIKLLVVAAFLNISSLLASSPRYSEVEYTANSNPEALTLKLPHPYLTSYEITTSLAGHQVLLAKSTSSSQAIPPPEVLHNNTLFFSNIAFLADNAVPPTGDNSSWARARKSPHLTVSWTAEPPSVPQIWLVAYALVTLHPLVEHLRVVFSGKNSDLVVQQLHATGLYHPHPKPSNVSAPQDGHLLLRGTFWQGAASPFGARPVWAPELDASNKPIANYPAFPFHNALVTQFPAVPRHTSHPVRKPKPQPGSVVYSRWIPHLKEHFTLIALDYTNLDHLSLFHNWQNDPREDHIGAYYQSSPYDRGRHSLVGDIRFRGPYRVSAWWSSLVHYLFLDEPRTWNLVGEPAATSSTVLAYDFAHGFHVEKLLDLPHKRSALMIVNREKFFTLSPFVWDGEQKVRPSLDPITKL